MRVEYFKVKGKIPTYAEILSETEEKLLMRITKYHDGDIISTKTWMDRTLFNTCLRTGYLLPAQKEEQQKLHA
ncbi:hypothetical protein WKV44_06900 [Spirochaetia bacterium 38H-sp]|uniref:Uncharacterized protein n=1 Tax=Rarispira pelagica TaxID=3141764 RepID=A0ABU9UC75_9SPIR